MYIKKNVLYFDIVKIGFDMLMYRIVKEVEFCMILFEWLFKMLFFELDVRDKDWEFGKKIIKV